MRHSVCFETDYFFWFHFCKCTRKAEWLTLLLRNDIIISKQPFIVYSGGYKSSKFFFLSPPSYLNVNLSWKTAFAISILFRISVCRHYTKYYIFLKLDAILLIKSLSAYALSLIMMENLAPLALPSLLAPMVIKFIMQLINSINPFVLYSSLI